jgi:hypothetical protein
MFRVNHKWALLSSKRKEKNPAKITKVRRNLVPSLFTQETDQSKNGLIKISIETATANILKERAKAK